jgi:hypothetical protein
MTPTNTIQIQDRTYHRNPTVDRFQIELDDLADLRMAEIPAHSHLEILGIPMVVKEFECEMWLVNGGDVGTDEYLSIYGGASIPVTRDTAPRARARLGRAFPDIDEYNQAATANISVADFPGRGLMANAFLSLSFQGRAETRVRDAIEPFVSAFRRLDMPDVYVFICHASEDKAIAREIAHFLRGLGSDVWFDEWEIKVGESIVQRIDGALGQVTHLLLLLSKHSVDKPWVKKEFSSALMRQLSNNSITVLPMRVDDSPYPTLLADIKYADARVELKRGLSEIEATLFSGNRSLAISETTGGDGLLRKFRDYLASRDDVPQKLINWAGNVDEEIMLVTESLAKMRGHFVGLTLSRITKCAQPLGVGRSVDELIQALSRCGILAPTTEKLKPGTYAEIDARSNPSYDMGAMFYLVRRTLIEAKLIDESGSKKSK